MFKTESLIKISKILSDFKVKQQNEKDACNNLPKSQKADQIKFMNTPEIKGVIINSFYDVINKKYDFQQMYLGYKLSIEKEGPIMKKYPVGLKIEEKKLSTASLKTRTANYNRIKIEFVNDGKEKFESFLKEIKDTNGNKLSESDIKKVISILTLVLRKSILDLTAYTDEKVKAARKKIAEKAQHNPSYLSRITQRGGKTHKKKKTKKTKIIKKKKSNKTKIIKKSQNKTCKKFCKKVFLPEKERVEKKISKYYEPIEVLRKKEDKFDRKLADILEDAYLKSCNDIYCQTKCKNKKSWINSINEKRKANLMKQGAISGCRDLIEEFPDYYKDI
jgi:hypothetical protein